MYICGAIFFTMLKKSLNGLLVVFLMLSYINRGLFVDMSEADVVCADFSAHTKNEINSVMELIFDLTGNPNDIDEDGDTPENYTVFHFAKLLVCQDLFQTLALHNHFPKDINESFFVFSDTIFSSPFYGQIDHPPQG
jgi:hypothetical protein